MNNTLKCKALHVIFVFLLSIISCYNQCNAQSTLSTLSFEEGKTTIIKNLIDMKGEELKLPKNVTLRFEKGGCFRNGSVKADNTIICGYKQGIFDNVQISGQWKVKYISTDMFKNNSQLNSLQNIFALASDKVNNIVTIEEGIYTVAAKHNGMTILSVPSNTEVIINGTISMSPNEFPNYYIMELKGENIKLHGKGAIIGDKHTHTGKTGEWGMGVILRRCKNVDMYDLTIKGCWGDCIYIGVKSTDIRINNCTIDHGRRQGISITSAGKVLIENCTISNISGTAPEYAIDVEPNINDTVDAVIVRNVKMVDCKGGILSWGGAKNALIRSIELYDCYVEGASKTEYNFSTSENIKVVNCISNRGTKPVNNKCKSFEVIE